MSYALATHSMLNEVMKKLNPILLNQISNQTMNSLKEKISKDKNSFDIKFITEILKQGKQGSFIVPNIAVPGEPGIGIISENINAIMCLALNTTDKKFLRHYNSKYILDLLHIHSFRKGEGKKLMETFLYIQSNLNIPGSLWTESIDNVKYFEKYGFINLGRLGKSSEFLMKLP
ncbi:hypothetical protein [Paenibacillus sp. NPDC058174]|uniref:hypothetical protein n=1 Tax=Paenibacillus sp. NPDC058174 TaxID=3346366 RepID=UPI0036DBFA00